MRSKNLVSLAAVAVALVLGARTAAAQYPTTAPVRPFVLPDLSGLTVIGLEFQGTWWNIPLPAPFQGEVDFKALTFDLDAEVSIAPHWVILGRLPLSYASVSTDSPQVPPQFDVDCCELALGNLTLGGRGLWSNVHGGDLRSVLGGELTVSVPTAADSGDGGQSAAFAAFSRAPHDPGRYAPNTTTIRLAADLQLYSRWFMVQGEAGVHFFLYDTDDDDDSDVGLKLGLAAGVRATTEIAILAELNALTDVDDDRGDDTVSSVDIGLRYGSQAFFASLRVYVPLDDNFRDLDMLGIGADLGLRF